MLSPSSSSFCFTNPKTSQFLNQTTFRESPSCVRLKPARGNGKKMNFGLKCVRSSAKGHTHNPSLSFSCLAVAEAAPVTTELVSDRVQRLVVEFGSLAEPIERVKQLLHYAALLPPLGEEARVAENRVTGCTTQVWVDAKLDELGRVRFRADSDSEITKGFISCLIWILDGAEPAEVAALRQEDLAAMNVGLYGKANSRVNTWHNVFISMQKRAKALAADRSPEPFPPLVADLTARYTKAQVLHSRRKNMAGNITSSI